MFRLVFNVASLMALAMVCQTANADLVLELTGTPGSNVISYTTSGSFTTDVAVSASLSTSAQLPTPSWSFGFDNELGDVLIDDSFASTQNDDLVLSAPISYLVNGVEFGILDTIDLDQDNVNGDDIELDNTLVINYPALVPGDIISFAPTSGTFTLDDGVNNFEDIFNTGTFTNAFGNFSVVVSATAVPEPSSLLFLLGAGAATLCVRRRS